eukprot:364590-Chlamydomonas_euryale.AAC.5
MRRRQRPRRLRPRCRGARHGGAAGGGGALEPRARGAARLLPLLLVRSGRRVSGLEPSEPKFGKDRHSSPKKGRFAQCAWAWRCAGAPAAEGRAPARACGRSPSSTDLPVDVTPRAPSDLLLVRPLYTQAEARV